MLSNFHRLMVNQSSSRSEISSIPAFKFHHKISAFRCIPTYTSFVRSTLGNFTTIDNQVISAELKAKGDKAGSNVVFTTNSGTSRLSGHHACKGKIHKIRLHKNYVN